MSRPRRPGRDRRRGRRPVAALALCLALAACGGGDAPRSAVLITLDTTRRDALSCYGAPAGLTPHLDALAAEALIYDDARTVAPITLPAHASMLTGLYPPRHGVRDNSLTPLPAAATTVAERAEAAGMQTAAFVAAIVLNDVYGVDQGFGVYDQPTGAVSGEHRYAERSGAEVAAAAVRWLEQRDREQPFLLWVHFFDPHGPNEPPREHLDRAGGDPYLGDVALMDDAVGVLLDALRADPAWEDTLVLVVGDHGEGRGEHGEETHSNFVYDSTLGVPFLLRDPDGHRAGERTEELATVADVYPTLMEALSLGNPGDVDGVSLFRRNAPPERGVYFESYHGLLYFQWSPLAGWADAGGKYIHSSAPELYATASDPDEAQNLLSAPDGAPPVEPYLDALRRLATRPTLAPDDETVDRSIIPALSDLGYAGSATARDVPDPLDAGDAPSPHARADELRSVMVARFYANRGRYGDALKLLDEVLDLNPRNHEALNRKGAYLMAAGRLGEAIEPLQRFTEVGPDWPNVWLNLAKCLRSEGRLDEAEAWLRRVVEADPRNRGALVALIDLLTKAERFDDAAEFQRRLLLLQER
ncbi:MAG: sulfatase-like hydrolase/transferase [Planctomycetota bacterium]